MDSDTLRYQMKRLARKRGSTIPLRSVEVGARWYLQYGNHLCELKHDQLKPALRIDAGSPMSVKLSEVEVAGGVVGYKPMRTYASRGSIRGTHLREIQ